MSLDPTKLSVERIRESASGCVHYAGLAVADTTTICGMTWPDWTPVPTEDPVTCPGCIEAGRWAIRATRRSR